MKIIATIELEFLECDFDEQELKDEIGFGAMSAVMDVTDARNVDALTKIEVIRP